MKRYCPVCGSHVENECAKCLNTKSVKCTPEYIPIPGYMSLSELDTFASMMRKLKNDCSAAPPPPEPPRPIDWFEVSMKLVKWTGILATCLGLIFFLTVVLKAFLS